MSRCLPQWLRKMPAKLALATLVLAAGAFTFRESIEARIFGPRIRLKVSQCACAKYVPLPNRAEEHQNHRLNVSVTELTCSEDLLELGPGQQVMAYSYYEDSTYDTYGRDYFAGIRENLDALQEFYPGFRMRLYYQLAKDSVSMGRLCEMACQEPNLDICDAENNPKYSNISHVHPTIWRFLAVTDAHVSLFFSRDLDSLPGSREREAVREFVNGSRAQIHVMRDNRVHAIGMLAGTWGAKLTGAAKLTRAAGVGLTSAHRSSPKLTGVRKRQPIGPDDRSKLVGAVVPELTGVEIRMKWEKSIENILSYRKLSQAPRTTRGADQELLMKYIYNAWGKRHMLAHDSYHCKNYPNSVGFPTQREDKVLNFVGAVSSLQGRLNFNKKNECPRQCRRNPAWIYC